MSDQDESGRGDDILAELEAEVAHELEEQRPPAGGTAYQVVPAVVTFAFGVLAAVLSYGYGLGTLRRPGAGLWPFVVALVIAVLSLVLLAAGRHLQDSERFSRLSLLVLAGLATFVGLGVLIPTIGFELPALGLCVIWLRFLGGESWRSTVVVSVATVTAFYLLFLYALSIPLPHLL